MSLIQDNPFDGLYCGRLRQEIWNMFENPNSSKAAKVWTVMWYLISYIQLYVVSDSCHRLLAIPLGLHLYADTLNHSWIPSNNCKDWYWLSKIKIVARVFWILNVNICFHQFMQHFNNNPSTGQNRQQWGRAPLLQSCWRDIRRLVHPGVPRQIHGGSAEGRYHSYIFAAPW